MTGRAITVIGAGIVGCLIARQLAEGDKHAVITVLDRDLVGSGASRRSAGLFLARGASPRTKRMSAFSHAYYANLKESHPHLPIFPVGATVVTYGQVDPGTIGYLPGLAAPAELAEPHAAPGRGSATGWIRQSTPENRGELPNPPGAWGDQGHWNDHGHWGNWSDRANWGDWGSWGDSRDRDGHPMRAGRALRAWRISGCHYADVHGVTQAIAELARPAIRFAEGVAVTGLSIGRTGVTVHCGNGEQLAADQVVLAPGPWLAEPAWRDLISPLGLRVKKIVAMHIEQRPDPADEVTLFDCHDAFLLPVHHRGHWLFSFTCTEWDVDPDQLTGGLSAANVEQARACLRRCAPALADACTSGRVCADAYSPSREPVISVLDGTHQRVVFAGGASGSGYRFAPAIAAQAADLALGTATTSEGTTDDHQHV